MSFPPMNELLAFHKVATHLSFKRAADELNFSPSTISHLIRLLEERLSSTLFTRTTRSVSLTESGQRFYNDLEQIFDRLNDVLDHVGDEENVVGGSVKINVNEAAAPILLEKLTPEFCENYPSIKIDLTVENRLVDIVAEGFDAGVRLKSMVPKDMIAVSIYRNFRFITVASPKYLRKWGKPTRPEDLKNHNCIGFRFDSRRLYQWEFSKDGKNKSIATSGSLTTNDPRLMIEAAKSGSGIAYIAEPLVIKELKSKKLEMVLADWQRDWSDLCLYFPRNRHMPPALRTVVNQLKC